MSLPNTLQTLRNRVISECELHPELKDKLHEIYFMAKSEVEDEESEESEVEMGLEAIDELMLVKEKGGVDPEAPPLPCRGNDRASETNPDIYASERVRKVCASCKKVSMIDVSRCIYCHECTRRLQDWRL